MFDDSQRLMRVEGQSADHGERLARMETKIDLLVERKSLRWLTVVPAIVSAAVSGSLMLALRHVVS
jgi:hypothetical protein